MPEDSREGATDTDFEDTTGDESEDSTLDFTRRGVMRAGGGLAAAGFIGDTWFEDDAFDLSEAQEVEVTAQGLEYFSIGQARVVHDLTGRIYPSDENGPGAPEAGVVYFVDDQMNSAWGRGDRWYMDPPFAGKNPTPSFEDEPQTPEDRETEVSFAQEDPNDTQGWQYSVTPSTAWDQGIEAVEEYAQNEYGDPFVDLDGDQQDEIVQALQDGEVNTFEDKGIDAAAFFLLARQNTLEGMFADPMWGGNREMIGWRLKNFPGTPGALGSYREQIAEDEYIEVGSDEFRKMADDVESLGLNGNGGEVDLGGENETDTAGNATTTGNSTNANEGHGHVHNAAEAEYPKIVDREAARGNADRDPDSDDDDEGGED
ncbi:gluconate 2-dehydrogenase subunit 3 family protein [Halorussus amylolyticus]|uniref:gluconate 2-dehydrogenase subunit 3 family protein n=1 Tax=Halorussus amylolyticus TaxID=1126242 RepID=UPI00192F93BE|nr:gluconate 2-dehydrogenase subunit 3 family protein [Halorussus amylolyticus]